MLAKDVGTGLGQDQVLDMAPSLTAPEVTTVTFWRIGLPIGLHTVRFQRG